LSEQAKLSEPPDSALMGRAIEGYQQVLSGFPTTPTRGEPRNVYVGAQLNLCDAQIALGRLKEAVDTCARTTQLSTSDPVGVDNLAGAYALLGAHDGALGALERDLALGDTDWEYLKADAWFTGLRGHPRFDAIVAEMKRRKG